MGVSAVSAGRLLAPPPAPSDAAAGVLRPAVAPDARRGVPERLGPDAQRLDELLTPACFESARRWHRHGPHDAAHHPGRAGAEARPHPHRVHPHHCRAERHADQRADRTPLDCRLAAPLIRSGPGAAPPQKQGPQGPRSKRESRRVGRGPRGVRGRRHRPPVRRPRRRAPLPRPSRPCRRCRDLREWINSGEGQRLGLPHLPDDAITPHVLRRTPPTGMAACSRRSCSSSTCPSPLPRDMRTVPVEHRPSSWPRSARERSPASGP
jgi:hypothetical protein